MVHPPATEPAALGLLFGADIGQGAGHCRMSGVVAEQPEGLHHVGRDIDAGRVERLAEIAERNPGQQLFVVVAVKRAPAAVGGLHGQNPVHGPGDRGVKTPVVRALFTQLGQDDQGYRSVVNIGIGGVGALKRPAAGCDLGQLDLPVSAGDDLLAENPGQGGLHRF